MNALINAENSRSKGKVLWSIMLVLAVMAGPYAGYASDDIGVLDEPLLKAKWYEQKAAEMETTVSYHKKMSNDASNAHMTDMVVHCDAIVKDAGSLSSKFRSFALWYREQAREAGQQEVMEKLE